MDDLITAKELHSYLNAERPPMVIDVRIAEAYARGHLPGAINMPKDQVYSTLNAIPADRSVVTYCNMHNPGSSGSESAAETLREAGFHARALQGGFPAWMEAGYPIDTLENTFRNPWNGSH